MQTKNTTSQLFLALAAIVFLFPGTLIGCAHRQTNLEWAKNTGSPIQTSGSVIRGKSLDELEVMVELYGLRRWVYPIDPENVAGSPYGMRTHPIRGIRKMHTGQDIPCSRFEPIYAVAKGEVVVSKRSKTAGRYIEVQHETKDGTDIRTRYMHLSTRRVYEGRSVRKGKKIGRCGNTGLSTGPHLHFEVEVNGKKVAPFSYVERSARKK